MQQFALIIWGQPEMLQHKMLGYDLLSSDNANIAPFESGVKNNSKVFSLKCKFKHSL